jgi:hypothetical protein
MTFRRSSHQICLGAATLALGGLLVCHAQPRDKGRGRPIEFSAPRSGEVTTNLHQFMSKPDGLKQLEEDSYKPLQPLAPQSSLDGVVALPTRPAATPVIQSKRVKEMLERRKNWVFMSPEDLVAAPTVEGILKAPALGPDGREQKELPALERYYERLATKRSAVNNPAQSKNDELFGPSSKSNPREEVAVQEDSDLPSSLRESAEALKKLLGPGGSDNPFVQEAMHGSLSDTFGLGNNTLSKEQIQYNKKYMDEYRSVLDAACQPPAIAVPGSPLDILAGAAVPAGKLATGLPSAPSFALNHGLEAQADVLNPMLGPPGLSDVNAQALGQTRPTLALPKIESTRVTPVAPSFDAPRRSFR